MMHNHNVVRVKSITSCMACTSALLSAAPSLVVCTMKRGSAQARMWCHGKALADSMHDAIVREASFGWHHHTVHLSSDILFFPFEVASPSRMGRPVMGDICNGCGLELGSDRECLRVNLMGGCGI